MTEVPVQTSKDLELAALRDRAYLSLESDPTIAVSLFEQMLAQAKACGNVYRELQALAGLPRAASHAGDFARTIETADQLLSAALQHGKQALAARTWIGRAGIMSMVGREAEALQDLETGLAAAQRLGLKGLQVRGNLTEGIIHMGLGHYGIALQALEAGKTLVLAGFYNNQGPHMLLAESTGNIAAVHVLRAEEALLQGDHARSIQHARQAVDQITEAHQIYVSQDKHLLLGGILEITARAYLLLNEIDTAYAFATQAAERYFQRAVDQHYADFMIAPVLGEIWLRRGEHAKAMEVLLRGYSVKSRGWDADAYERLLKMLAEACGHMQDYASAFRYQKELETCQRQRLSQNVHERAILLSRRFEENHDLRRSIGAIEFLSHDIRAPLSAILVTARDNQASGTRPGAADSEALAVVQRLATRALAFTDEFLMFARASRVHANQFRELMIAEIVQEACQEIAPMLKAKALELATEFDDALFVMGDQPLLFRAVTNLLGNAIKASPQDGRIEVSIEARLASADATKPDEQARHDCVISVRDQGPGYSRQVLNSNFHAFGAAHGGSSSGLGMALVKNVARLHRGDFSVRNDNGAIATLVLPVHRRLVS
jgi:signal transduction histidine kinase